LLNRIRRQNGGLLLRDGQIIQPLPWTNFAPFFTRDTTNALVMNGSTGLARIDQHLADGIDFPRLGIKPSSSRRSALA
jgi:hypothetical protein